MKNVMLLIAVIALAIAGAANAAEVLVSSNISASTTWTADNTYNLQNQVYVLPGATLTIEPGTLIKSTANLGGSLAVCKGAKIYAEGTATSPIIFTSTNDNMTSWREGANEWGNLTIMGDAYISASDQTGNTATFGNNQAPMEGLTADFAGDTKVLYGGTNDNDDSGIIAYVSIRYGGKVVSLAKELNGLSLGGIGRETDIHHIEIMNNVDDGIEVWGGTVNLSFLNIWNIGDDSLDIDQGYRGKVQFGLIVQGYSVDAAQGSGVGDNCIEIDGAEMADAQPVTTTRIYNMTVVGQPIKGDHGTAWRDNARVQYRNCVWTEVGEKLVKNDGDAGEGMGSYGFNGTLSWEDTWSTQAGTDPNMANALPAGTVYADYYNAQDTSTGSKLAEIKDSVFHSIVGGLGDAPINLLDSAYNNVSATLSPIQELVRGTAVVTTIGNIVPVIYINPCAANDAVSSVSAAPNDGFFKPAYFRGGFSATHNWLDGWTAADAYRMTDTSMNTANGDINGDGFVDFADFAVLGADWLNAI